jgi:hypothetical protein
MGVHKKRDISRAQNFKKININFDLIKESYKQKFIQSSHLDEIRKIFKVLYINKSIFAN